MVKSDADGNRYGRPEGMKGMAKGAERKAIVEGRAGARAGRCG